MSSLDELDLSLRAAIQTDRRIQYAAAYGSRTQVPGGVRQDDEFSDLEYYVHLHSGEHLDPLELVNKVTPVVLTTRTAFGTPNFVTPELHRIELHVVDSARLEDLLEWSVWSPDPAQMLVKDEHGLLERLLERFAAQANWAPELPQVTFDGVLNALVSIRAFVRRGELLRAYEWHALFVLGGLTRLARHAKQAAQPPAALHWAERELSTELLERLNACACGGAELEVGWICALNLCNELARCLQLDERAQLQAALSAFIPPESHPASGD
jgi:lincosamide nucleotidyltransferase B/F